MFDPSSGAFPAAWGQNDLPLALMMQGGGFYPTRLSPGDEAKFQTEMGQGGYKQWADTFRQRFGESPNLNDPQYDYRAAWQNGIVPQPYAPDQNFPHWPSALSSGQMLKAPHHPTAWMEHFVRQYGVDPNMAAPQMLAQGVQQGIVPGNWQPSQPFIEPPGPNTPPPAQPQQLAQPQQQPMPQDWLKMLMRALGQNQGGF